MKNKKDNISKIIDWCLAISLAMLALFALSIPIMVCYDHFTPDNRKNRIVLREDGCYEIQTRYNLRWYSWENHDFFTLEEAQNRLNLMKKENRVKKMKRMVISY